MDNVRWKVTDPLGTEISLGEENFKYHIIGQHDTKDAKVRADIEPQAKFAVEHPRFIIRDLQCSGRMKYLNLINIKDENKVYIRTIAVIVETNGEVVTWFARRTINDNLEEGDVIYDARNNDLQI
ncbi:MAG: hypothetical protein IJS81_05645 [Selenomonadaceae bacterium]|nr:hypothetical protein [Selenomonadaceae bacterium]MBQ7629679.1 hypothetical protein [Selenomonadaceae bacterium]